MSYHTWHIDWDGVSVTFFFFFYPYVHTMFGSFLPLSPTPSLTPPPPPSPLSLTFYPTWPQTVTLPISASQVAGIIEVWTTIPSPPLKCIVQWLGKFIWLFNTNFKTFSLPPKDCSHFQWLAIPQSTSNLSSLYRFSFSGCLPPAPQ
jgi:hypothetical protein